MRFPTAGPRNRNWSLSGAGNPPPRRWASAGKQQSARTTNGRARRGSRMIVYDTRTRPAGSYTGTVRCIIACALLAAAAPAADDSLSREMLAAHNAVRAIVKVPPLIWSDQL